MSHLDTALSRQNRLENKLSQALQPSYLDVINESHNHQVPSGSQTHFKIILVTSHFDALSRVERHRLINRLLLDEFKTGLHALSLQLFTPKEWEKTNKHVLDSPLCQHKRI